MKIILSGGGTLGPVMPLLAIAETYRAQYPDTKFIWVGTKNGPERAIVESYGIPFFTIGAGKWRRYVSLWNILDLFKIIISFFQSVYFLWREQPNLLISCGGYVSVPLHWAAGFLAMPAWVHQQDVRIGLANKCMFGLAKKITTALRETAANLPARKTEWIGNPSRDLTVADATASRKKFGIPDGAPVIFALGGGTGSASINKLILDAVPHWPDNWHVIHLVGKERPRELQERAANVFDNYHVYQFFNEEMRDAYAAADVVIARAGFGTLTELAALAKPAIIMPMFDTHQEDNARLFAKHNGVILIEKGTNSGLKLAQIVKDLIEVPEKRAELGSKLHQILPRARPEKIIEIINNLTKLKIN